MYPAHIHTLESRLGVDAVSISDLQPVVCLFVYLFVCLFVCLSIPLAESSVLLRHEANNGGLPC